jgi:hypothetical protein
MINPGARGGVVPRSDAVGGVALSTDAAFGALSVTALRHHVPMRRAATLALAALLCCAACSATAAQTPPSSPSSTAAATPPPSPSPSLSAPGPASGSATRPSATPAAPSVPADVPRTGPNTRPGETPPVMPLLASQHSAAGAKAFAEFFIKTIDWGYATTSSTYMRHYFSKTCIGCLSTAVALDKAAHAKHHFIGDRVTVKSAMETRPPSMNARHLLATFDVTSTEVVDADGRYVDATPALNDLQQLVDLSWQSGRWVVDGFTAKL